MSTKELERTNEESQVEEHEAAAPVDVEAFEPQPQESEQPQADAEPDGLEDYEREWMQQVQEQEDEVAAKEATWLALKEEAAAAKKSFELAQSQLRRLVRQGPQKPAAPDPQQRLFGEEEPQQDDSWRDAGVQDLQGVGGVDRDCLVKLSKAGIASMGELAAALKRKSLYEIEGFSPITIGRIGEAFLLWRESLNRQPSDAWRKAPVSELVNHGPLAPSDLKNLEAAGIETIGQLEDLRAGAGLASVKGFGPVAVERVTEALLAWLTEHRDKAAFEAARAASEPDSDEMTPEEFAQAALGLLNTIQFGKFPAEAEEFLESVADDLRAVRDTVERTGVVTERQREALTNWEEGVSKWLRH